MKSTLIRRGAVAAVVVLVLGISVRMAMRGKTGVAREIGPGENDIAAPARNKSIRTVENGGVLLNNPPGSTVVNVKLSDGTSVWLNAGSSIRYPAEFPSDDRTVEVTGEAYIQVAADARRQFSVRRGNLSVDVLDGSLDIRAYNEEPMVYVTPVGGKLRVRGDNEVTVDAGDQAVVNGRVELVKGVHTEGITAWKDGLFSFSHTTLVDATHELSHWYGVTVVFRRAMPDRYLTGRLDRTLTLDEVLKTLTDGRVQYSIDPLRRQLTIE